MSVCRSCGADIVWGVTQTGKQMPLDPEPVMNGNVVFVHGSTVRVIAIADDVGSCARYLSHFTTCPNASSHRRRGQ